MKQFLFKINNLFINYPSIEYYIKHPHVFLINRLIVIQLWLKKILRQDINFTNNNFSPLPIDVVLVTAQKDYEVLIHVVASINKYIKHPVGKIIIISPKSKLIVNLCKKMGCIFIDENKVLPVIRRDIKYTVRGVDRSGWLFQQLLKYAAEKYCTNQHYLVTEADTIFLRPRVFEKNGKLLLPCCNELCHISYFHSYKKILGKEIFPYVNFTSHHTLINKTRLKQLKLEIGKYCKKPWYRAIIENIDKTDGSAISDYETYGQFMFYNFNHEIELEDWSNISLKRPVLGKINALLKTLAPNYKTVSFHSYNQ